MQNTLQTVKHTTNIQTTPANSVKNNSAENKPSSSESNLKDKYFNTKTIVGSLLGLATIGTAAFFGVRHFKRSSIQENLANKTDTKKLQLEIDNIKERIDSIKKLIRKNYLEQKNYLYKDFANSDEYGVNVRFENLNDLKNRIKTLKTQKTEKQTHADEVINKTKKTVKDKLAKLSSNPEWKEIKLLRKKYIKQLNSSNDAEQRKIASEKIPLINDLIYNRIYPESIENYTNLYGIEDKKVLELVKKEFTSHEEFIKEFDSLKHPSGKFDYDTGEKRITHNGKLSLKDVFPKEFDIISSNEKIKKENNSQLDELEKTYKIIIEKLKNLAERYRKSSEVKELHSLIAQMRTKQNLLAKAEQIN